jgi:hypothetical protein
MPIQSKDDAQDKAGRRVDRNLFKKKKQLPLIERDFRDLYTLAEQFEWIRLKKIQKERERDNIK